MENQLDWDEVVEDLGPRLFKYFALRFSHEQADDMTQETLVRLVRKVRDGKFDPDKGTLKMLGFGIAHYVALEFRPVTSVETIENWPEILTDDPGLEYIAVIKDLAVKVRGQIKHLTPMEQQALSLSIDQDLVLSEISWILQIPQGTVKSHIFRAKKKLIGLIRKENLV